MSRLPESVCFNCGNKLDTATHIQEEADVLPTEGDISICGYCGQLGAYDHELKITPLREDEAMKIMKEYPDIKEDVEKIRSIFLFLKSKGVSKN